MSFASDTTPAPRTRAEAVVGHLREQIRTGKLAPGTPLRQVRIAVELGVSTTPVREAFRVLAREGLVRHDPHRGAVVFLPSLQELAENYEIRCALEPLAARHAAQLISDEALARLEVLMQAITDEVSDRHVHGELNRAFHSEIHRAARRPRLAEFIDTCRNNASGYIALVDSTEDPTYAARIRAEHEDILNALRSRDPLHAKRAMSAHLKSGSKHVTAAVARYLSSGSDS
jgi:DNA-binding GntR family transcriptional regulator